MKHERTPTLRLEKIEPGWYRVTIKGDSYEIIDMRGQSVLHSGLAPHWKIKIDGATINECWTLNEAKAWLVGRM
jgi:hypothetical protein